MASIQLTTCQAANAEGSVREIAAYLKDRWGLPVETVLDIAWRQRMDQFDGGEIEVAWLCGLQYVQRADLPGSDIQLLAAPVMLGERYNNRPVYFSDVIVRADSPFSAFDDLAGATWGYNEPTSHSGYNVVRYHLAILKQPKGFFGGVIEVGSHENGLQLLLKGEIEAMAIDSTVLETEIRNHPGYEATIRVIEKLGPSPMPPYATRASFDEDMRKTLREALTEMHQDPMGREVLTRHGYLRFAEVRDGDYDPIRRMKSVADEAGVALMAG